MIKLDYNFNMDTQLLECMITDGQKMSCTTIKWDEKPQIVLNGVKKVLEAFERDQATTLAGTP